MNLTKLITLAALGVVQVQGFDLRKLGANDATDATDVTDSCSSTALSHESKVMAGYMSIDDYSGSPTKISTAASKGYTVVIASFMEILGTAKPAFYGNTFNAYGSWNTADTEGVAKKIRDDIKVAKDSHSLKYALVTTGGGSNLFSPGKTKSAETLATEIKEFLDKYDFDGIDFDIEHLGWEKATDVPKKNEHIDGDYIFELIKELRKKDSSMIITGAPQINHNIEDGVNKISFVNIGHTNVFKKAAAADNCFDYLFAQEYNTSNYYVKEGEICAGEDKTGCFSEKDVEFMRHSYPALAKQVSSNTKIVMGQPATKTDGWGEGHVHYGKNATTIYSSLGTEYKTMKDDSTTYPKFGGAMTWQIKSDKDNDWKFVTGIKSNAV